MGKSILVFTLSVGTLIGLLLLADDFIAPVFADTAPPNCNCVAPCGVASASIIPPNACCACGCGQQSSQCVACVSGCKCTGFSCRAINTQGTCQNCPGGGGEP